MCMVYKLENTFYSLENYWTPAYILIIFWYHVASHSTSHGFFYAWELSQLSAIDILAYLASK